MKRRDAERKIEHYQEEYRRMFLYVQQAELYIKECVALGEYERIEEGIEEFHPLIKEWSDKAGVCMKKIRQYQEKING